MDCGLNHYAVIFDQQSVYVVPDTQIHAITKHIVQNAEVHDNAYLIETSNITSINSSVAGLGKSATTTHTTNCRRSTSIKRIFFKMTNPDREKVTKLAIHLSKRGGPLKTPEQSAAPTRTSLN